MLLYYIISSRNIRVGTQICSQNYYLNHEAQHVKNTFENRLSISLKFYLKINVVHFLGIAHTKRAALLQCCRNTSGSTANMLQNGLLLQLQISAAKSSAEQLFGSNTTAVLQRYLKHEYCTKALHDAAKGLVFCAVHYSEMAVT